MRFEKLDIGGGERWYLLVERAEARALAACANADDDTRAVLGCLVLTRTGIAATNGKMAVRWRDDEADAMPVSSFARLVHRDVVDAAAKACTSDQLVALPIEHGDEVLIWREGGDLFDPIAARFDAGTEEKASAFPNVEAIFGRREAPGFGYGAGPGQSIGFCPTLMGLVAATAKRFGCRSLIVDAGGPDEPIYLRAAETYSGGVLDMVWMPIRLAAAKEVAT